jgi:hypothetical protein
MNAQTPNGGVVGVVGSLSEVLGETRAWYQKFIYVVNDTDLDVLALWTIHTYLCAETYTTPRLLIESPLPGSGKTTLLEHLGKLAYRPLLAASVSQAVLARITADGVRTLLLDEADRMLNPKRPGVDDLLAVLNSGYKVSGMRVANRPVKGGGWEFEELPTFSPVALAGNTPLLPDDTRSRCIVIRLLPDIDGITAETNWRDIEPLANALAAKISATADSVREQVASARFDVPPGCKNRMRERWEPLKQIAATASAEWADLTDQLIIKAVQAERQLADNSDIQSAPHIQLAKDLWAIFKDEPGDLKTELVVGLLIKENPNYWSSSNTQNGRDLTPQRLGRMLASQYDIQAARLTGNTRGYRAGQFQVIWHRLGITQNKPTTPTTPTESELF